MRLTRPSCSHSAAYWRSRSSARWCACPSSRARSRCAIASRQRHRLRALAPRLMHSMASTRLWLPATARAAASRCSWASSTWPRSSSEMARLFSTRARVVGSVWRSAASCISAIASRCRSCSCSTRPRLFSTLGRSASDALGGCWVRASASAVCSVRCAADSSPSRRCSTPSELSSATRCAAGAWSSSSDRPRSVFSAAPLTSPCARHSSACCLHTAVRCVGVRARPSRRAMAASMAGPVVCVRSALAAASAASKAASPCPTATYMSAS